MNTTRISFWAAPLQDYDQFLQHLAREFKVHYLLLLLFTLLLGWWIYVPVHELLHAFGCIWSGGNVTRLELSPEYGAAWLQHYFPWIAVGSDYAGQLTGFDTNGSDFCYLVTILLPFVLTVFPGVFLFHLALRMSWKHAGPWAVFGFSGAMVIAPFISIIGDMYEASSVVISRLASVINPAIDRDRWRSDDLPQLISALWPELHSSDILGVLSGSLLAICLCWLIYNAGRWLAGRLFSADSIRNTQNHHADS